MIRTVRTTMQPDRPINVDDGEYADLVRQGLLLPEPAAPQPPTPPFVPPVPVAQPVNNQENPA